MATTLIWQVAHTANNAETLLKAVLDLHSVAYTRLDDDDELPLVDGRCQRVKSGGTKEWCIVSTCKDCRPAEPWCHIRKVAKK